MSKTDIELGYTADIPAIRDALLAARRTLSEGSTFVVYSQDNKDCFVRVVWTVRYNEKHQEWLPSALVRFGTQNSYLSMTFTSKKHERRVATEIAHLIQGCLGAWYLSAQKD